MPQKKDRHSDKEESGQVKVPVYDLEAHQVSTMQLPSFIFAAKINPPLVAQAVRVYLANQRLGTHDTKTRSEVSGSTRKIYRQKGTGRARHGSKKAPIFKGGGVAHGPKPTDYSLDFPQKMRHAALFSTLTDKVQNKAIQIVTGLERIGPKTKEFYQILLDLHVREKNGKKDKKVLVVLPNPINNIVLAGRNLENVTITQAKLLNAYEVMTHRILIFAKDAIDVLKVTFTNQVRGKEEKVKEEKKVVKSVKVIKVEKDKKKEMKVTKQKKAAKPKKSAKKGKKQARKAKI